MRTTHLFRGVVALALTLAVWHSLAVADPGTRYRLNVPPQPVFEALKAFAAQTRLQVIYYSDAAEGLASPGAFGELTAGDALRQLLGGTGLGFQFVTERTIAIRAAGSGEDSASTLTGTADERPFLFAQLANHQDASGGVVAQQASGQSASGQSMRAETVERPKDAATLEEIIVTAQKREESLKDVPISITAIGGVELEALRVQGVQDYILEIPNATFTDFGGFGSSVSLRGINAFGGGLFAPVAILVDDLGFGAIGGRPVILDARFFDLERIEVLNGPQGVLTGRSALGGAINLITAKPDTDAFEFKGTLDYGRFDTRFVKAVLNTPLSDTFAVRTVGYMEESDGAVRNIGLGGGGSYTDNYGGRIAARWQPSEAFSLDASFSYEKQDLGTNRLRTDAFTSPEERAAVLAELESWGGDFFATDFFEDVGNNGGTVETDVEEGVTRTNEIASLGARYAWGRHALELKYSHFSYDNTIVFDWDQTNFAWFRGDWGTASEADSAEIKLSSQYDGAINWVAGVGYLEEEYSFFFTDGIGEWASGANDGLPIFGGSYDLADVGEDRTLLESLGFFANVFWDLSERLHLSVGGRVSIEEARTGSFFVADSADPRFVRGERLRLEDFDAPAEITKFTPRIALNFDLNDQVTSYIQYATGYRAGYRNNARAIQLGKPEKVQPETVTNYELGLKGQVMEDRLNFALALFYMKYEDLQLTQTAGDPGSNPENPVTFTFDSNFGSSVSQGVELQGAWLATDALRLAGAVAYTDATLDSVIVDGEILRDVPVLGIRPWTARLSATYERPVTETLDGSLRLSWHYQDAAYTEGVVETPIFNVPAFDTLDLSVGVAAGDRWALTAYAENLLDEKYFLSSQFEAGTSRRGAMANFVPRIWGLRFTVSLRK